MKTRVCLALVFHKTIGCISTDGHSLVQIGTEPSERRRKLEIGVLLIYAAPIMFIFPSLVE